MSSRDLRSASLLLAGGTLVGLLLGEIGARLLGHLEDRGLLTAELELPPAARGSPATLGGMIQRAADPRLIYELRPQLEVYYEGARVTTNDQGFRGRPRPRARTARSFRIVGLGDSFMFGLGVADEQTYLARLEERLAAALPFTSVETINLAVPGYNGVMEVQALKSKGLAYRPDLVIIEFVGNDLDLPNFIRRSRDVWSLRESFLLSLVGERWGRLRSPGRARGRPRYDLVPAPEEGEDEDRHFLGDAARVPPQYADMVGLESYRAALRELSSLSERGGFRVVFMGWDAVPEERRIRRLAQSLGFHVLNLWPPLERHLQENGYHSFLESPLARSPRDAHPSARGHEMVSDWLYAFLREERLLPDVKAEVRPARPARPRSRSSPHPRSRRAAGASPGAARSSRRRRAGPGPGPRRTVP